MTIKVQIKTLPHFEGLPLPQYATAQAACMDIYAAVTEPVTLQPGDRVAVPTGLVLEIPPGYEGQVRPRSGLALKHGITMLNAPGTIDPGYRGEVKVILCNQSSVPYTIQAGDRIAQLIVASYEAVEWEEGTPGESARGQGGFGSSGR